MIICFNQDGCAQSPFATPLSAVCKNQNTAGHPVQWDYHIVLIEQYDQLYTRGNCSVDR